MSTRERVVELVRAIPESDPPTIERMLQGLLQAGEFTWETAPIDDEPYTEEEQAEDAEAIAAITRGEGVSHDAIAARTRKH